MGEVHQHPDGFVYVSNGNDLYGDSVQNFALDSGVALPGLPPGADERIYDQGLRHAIMGGDSVLAGGPMPWPMGDGIIANLSALIAAKAAREMAAHAKVKAVEDAAEQASATALAAQIAQAVAASTATRAPAVARKASFLASPDAADLIQRLRSNPGAVDTWIAGNAGGLPPGVRNVLAAMLKVMATQID